jgi:hypothetical protein
MDPIRKIVALAEELLDADWHVDMASRKLCKLIVEHIKPTLDEAPCCQFHATGGLGSLPCGSEDLDNGVMAPDGTWLRGPQEETSADPEEIE